MVAVATSSPWETREDLTDITDEKVLDRAADIVLGLARGRGGLTPGLLGALACYLGTDNGRKEAAQHLLDEYGYVSAQPAAFVSLKLSDESWPTGF